MPDPFTLTAVSSAVLPQLVKLVFEQAGKVIENRKSASAKTRDQEAGTFAELEQAAQILGKYAVEGAQAHITDRALLDALSAALQRIESLTGTPLDLAAGLKHRGVNIEFSNDDIDGAVTGVKATAITDKADVSVKFNDNIVRASGEFTAVEVNGPIG